MSYEICYLNEQKLILSNGFVEDYRSLKTYFSRTAQTFVESCSSVKDSNEFKIQNKDNILFERIIRIPNGNREYILKHIYMDISGYVKYFGKKPNEFDSTFEIFSGGYFLEPIVLIIFNTSNDNFKFQNYLSITELISLNNFDFDDFNYFLNNVICDSYEQNNLDNLKFNKISKLFLFNEKYLYQSDQYYDPKIVYFINLKNLMKL